MSNIRKLENQLGFVPTYRLISPLWGKETDEDIRPKAVWVDMSNGNTDPTERQPGCLLACIYCNQQWMDRSESGEKDSGILSPGDAGLTLNLRINFGKKTVKEVSIDQVIELLRAYPLYDHNGSILIGNYTDPGLNWPESCELAKRIVNELDHSGPILFITKMPVSGSDLEHLTDLQKEGGKVVVIVTYSGMPKKIEPASAKKRVTALKSLHEAGIPTILSMRPMIVGINGTPENIAGVLTDCQNYVDAVIYGGLFVYPETASLFANVGYPLPADYAGHNYTVAKKNDPLISAMIYDQALRCGLQVPIYEHTNCAVSYIMTNTYAEPSWNKLAHWALPRKDGCQDDFDNCSQICPPKQMANCVERSNAPEAEITRQIQEALIDMKLVPESSLTGGMVKVVRSEANNNLYLITNVALNVLQIFQVMERVGVRVDNLPNREQFIMRAVEAFGTHLSVDETKIVGAVQCGQEWVLLVNGDITNDGNELLTKYVRTTARCRCNVLDVGVMGDRPRLEQWLQNKGYLSWSSLFENLHVEKY